jgi:hypothetical protein
MKTALRLAVAAVVAQAPRLLLATAGIYGAPLSPAVRLGLAMLSSVASAAVLTGGCAYLAHAVAVAERNRGLLAFFWGLTALSVVVILAPEIVAAIPETHLRNVLASSAGRWIFAITLAGFAEVVASGLAVAAASLEAGPRVPHPAQSSGLISLGLSDARTPAPQSEPAPAPQVRAGMRKCGACGEMHRDSQQGAAAHARYCGKTGKVGGAD